MQSAVAPPAQLQPGIESPRGRVRPRRFALALAGVAWIAAAVAVLALPQPVQPARPVDGVLTSASQLRGDGPRSDFAADYVGARAMLHGTDAYPVLGTAFAAAGIDWKIEHRSTHPPTAQALALPLARLPWNVAAAAWGLAMLLTLALAMWAFGLSLPVAFALAPFTLLWPPVAWSTGQLTPLWLLGIALAWRFRGRAGRAGAVIACAAATKFFPVIAIVPLLIARRWRAAAGFAAISLAVAGAVALVDPHSFLRYVEVARATSLEEAARPDNAAVAAVAKSAVGGVGTLLTLALVAAVVAPSIKTLLHRRDVDRATWDAWTWAAVALLPVAWIYSLLVLAPTLLRLVVRGSLSVRLVAGAAVLIPLVIAPYDAGTAPLLALSVALTGIALLLGARRPYPRFEVDTVPS